MTLTAGMKVYWEETGKFAGTIHHVNKFGVWLIAADAPSRTYCWYSNLELDAFMSFKVTSGPRAI